MLFGCTSISQLMQNILPRMILLPKIDLKIIDEIMHECMYVIINAEGSCKCICVKEYFLINPELYQIKQLLVFFFFVLKNNYS